MSQSEIMDMKEEMMNDALDDALGDEDDEEERCVFKALTPHRRNVVKLYDSGYLMFHKPW